MTGQIIIGLAILIWGSALVALALDIRREPWLYRRTPEDPTRRHRLRRHLGRSEG